jgi:hypothetical protein
MITLNGKNIPVDKNFSVRMSWVNPACFFDKIPGNAGLGIRIPVNDYSRAYFGNPERFEKYSPASDRKFPGFEIRKNGILYESGTLVITMADNEYYNGWLQPEVGAMGEKLQDKFITEFNWKEGAEIDIKAAYDPDEDEYCLVKIVNENFWEGKGSHGVSLIPILNENNEPDTIEEYVNNLELQHNTGYAGEINSDAVVADDAAKVVSPFLFLKYFVKELLRMNRFYIRSSTLDNIPGAQNLVLYNNYNVFNPTPATTSDVVYQTFNRREGTYTNVTREQIDTVTWQAVPFRYADLVPKLSLKDTLLSIQNFLNVCFVFNPDRTVNIIDREAILTEPAAFDLTPWQVSPWRKTGERKHTSLKFIAEYDKNDANFGDGFHDLSDRWRDFKDPVDKYADLLVITSRHNPDKDRTLGQLRYVRDENRIYEYKWTVQNSESADRSETQADVLGWELVSSGPQYFVYHNGDEIEEIKTNISTLQMENSQLSARQPGNVIAMRSRWTDFTFRLFYYLGGHQGGVENFTVGSCNWEGDTGIFNKRWSKWARFWSTRQQVEADFDLPQNVLQFVKNNITSKFRTEKGEFIIEEISADIGITHNGITTIKGYKV